MVLPLVLLKSMKIQGNTKMNSETLFFNFIKESEGRHEDAMFFNFCEPAVLLYYCTHQTWVAAQAGHYAALGVAVDFGAAAELRKAYKRASLAAHPDRGGSADAFAKVAAAHDTLRHAAARAGYDLGDDLPRGAHRAAERDARPRPTASWPAPRGSSAVRCGLTPSGPFRAGAQEDGSEGPPLPEV
jgi:hypothetical protein